VGSKRIIELSTVSFMEFINYRTAYKYENRLDDFFKVENEKVKVLLNEYFRFGGYPRIIIADSIKEKKKEMDEIYQSYIEKDISYLLNIQKTEKISSPVKLLSAKIGRIINYSEISNILCLSVETVKKYLWYLEKTFIIKRITPFYKMQEKRLPNPRFIIFMI